jgi:hypothetical protein
LIVEYLSGGSSSKRVLKDHFVALGVLVRCGEMRLFRTKTWDWLDIALLKWSCILFGMIAGAFLSEFVMLNVWVFLGIAWLLAIKPAIAYFKH